jgi:glycerophosphoryl diester phosphodiesterase
VDGVECDVRLSRDGHPVCVHDRRLDRTSNGHGPVRRYTLEQLAEYDFGSWYAGRPAQLLTLGTLLGAVRDVGRPVRVLIETKHPSRGGRALESALVEVLRRFNLHRPEPDDPGGVAVMSFWPPALRRMRLLAPWVPRVLLEEFPVRRYASPLRFGATAFGPDVQLLRRWPRLATGPLREGSDVYVWTANTAADIDLCLRLGVTGIISDRPDRVGSRIAAAGGESGAGPAELNRGR